MKELSLFVLDILENALSADASCVGLEIRERCAKNFYLVEISGNGREWKKRHFLRCST